jgi:manganese efflux pump family protein
MVRSGLDSEETPDPVDPSRGRTLVMLCIATSIDALAVGLSLAMLRVSIWQPSIIIGVVTASMSLGGLLLGYRLGETFGKRTEIVGGLVLIGIGLRILISHLL